MPKATNPYDAQLDRLRTYEVEVVITALLSVDAEAGMERQVAQDALAGHGRWTVDTHGAESGPVEIVSVAIGDVEEL